MIFGIFGTEFSVFFSSYHLVSHPKNSVSLQSETSETYLFFRYFAWLIFAFVSLPSEMRGHPTRTRGESNSHRLYNFCVWQFMQFSLFWPHSLFFLFTVYVLACCPALGMQLNRNRQNRSEIEVK